MATLVDPGQSFLPVPVRRSRGAAAAIIGFCVFFMLAFPKGGIKVGIAPLTFGYAMTIPVLAIAMLRTRQWGFPVDRLMVLGACFAMSAWTLAVIWANGTTIWAAQIGFLLAILIMPIFGMIAFSGALMADLEPVIERSILWAIRFVVAFGLFLFVFKYVTGQWIEIPLLTVNAADVGQLDDKHINRNGVFKLISTYNNGNILGVAMCIIAPLYLRLEPRKLLQGALYLTLLLTLSRTVWLGFLTLMLMRILSSRLQIQTLLSLLVGTVAGVVLIYGMLLLVGADSSFLADTNLGGRVQQVVNLADATVLPRRPVGVLPEIVYAGVLVYFGYIGFVLFLGMMFITPILLKAHGVPLLSTSRASACMQGLLLYAALSLSDAALSGIPIMMIFWMVAGLGLWYVRYQRH
jgi:hypothetical protein